jgi:hypothetical protein
MTDMQQTTCFETLSFTTADWVVAAYGAAGSAAAAATPPRSVARSAKQLYQLLVVILCLTGKNLAGLQLLHS